MGARLAAPACALWREQPAEPASFLYTFFLGALAAGARAPLAPLEPARYDSLSVAEAGSSRVLRVTPQGAEVLAGGGASGALAGSADGYGTAALFPAVWSVAVTPAGAIYVAAGTALRLLTCAPCPAGSVCAGGAPLPCPGGHFCPAGTTSTARQACGRGSFCPDGSALPQPCPIQLPPAGGWGAQLVQGPAFVIETAHCLNHCFWNFTAGADGLLSKC